MVLVLHESKEKLKKSSDEVISRKYDLKLEQLKQEQKQTIDVTQWKSEVQSLPVYSGHFSRSPRCPL